MARDSMRHSWSARRLAAWGAGVWSLMFAAISFYWAAGGLAGVETLGEGMYEFALARDPVLIGVTWLTGVLKVVAGLFPLSLVQAWGWRIPHWIKLAGLWGAGLLFIFYGAVNMIQHGRMVAGLSPIPALIGSMSAVQWHLLFWDPFWLVGGMLFIAAAWLYRRAPEQGNCIKIIPQATKGHSDL